MHSKKSSHFCKFVLSAVGLVAMVIGSVLPTNAAMAQPGPGKESTQTASGQKKSETDKTRTSLINPDPNEPLDSWMPNKKFQKWILASLNEQFWRDHESDNPKPKNPYTDLSALTKESMKTLKELRDRVWLQDASDNIKFTTLSDKPGIDEYSIEGLQYATNLESIYVEPSLDPDNPELGTNDYMYLYGDIVDVSPIANLTNLTSLVLQSERIHDITPILGVINNPKLTELSLVRNSILDFSGITNPNLAEQYSRGWLAGSQLIFTDPVKVTTGNRTYTFKSRDLLKEPFGKPLGAQGNPNTLPTAYEKASYACTWLGTWHGTLDTAFLAYNGAYDGSSTLATTGADQSITFTAQREQARPQPTAKFGEGEAKLLQLHYASFFIVNYGDTTIFIPYEIDPTVGKPVTVHYQDSSGKTIAEDKQVTGNFGDAFDVNTPEFVQNIPGYQFQIARGRTSGHLTNYPQEVTLVYAKTGSVRVHYREVGTNTVLREDKVISGLVGDSYQITTDQETIPGWEYQSSSPANSLQGTFANSEKDLTLYYRHLAGEPVTVRYRDSSGQPIKGVDDELLTGLYGDTFTVEHKAIPGWNFLRVSQGSDTGTFGSSPQTVILTYERADGAAATIHYRGDDGTVLAEDEVVSGKWGTPFTVEHKSFTGWSYSKTQDRNGEKVADQGELSGDPQEITVVYVRNEGAAVTVHYRDDQGKPIPGVEDVILRGKFGTEFDTSNLRKPIQGWVFLSSPDPAKGTFTDQAQSVTLIYKKNTVVNPQNPGEPGTEKASKDGSSGSGNLGLSATGSDLAPILMIALAGSMMATNLIVLARIGKRRHHS